MIRVWKVSVFHRLYLATSNTIAELANAGIGVHHAGLNMDDRRATEALFLDGTLRVVVATSVSC